ncbi:hypothetical protein LTR53_009555, partial [Teratosphaeriaceae sp. CCFEE 6253]
MKLRPQLELRDNSSSDSSPESPNELQQLQREAEEDSASDDAEDAMRRRDSGAKLRAWRKHATTSTPEKDLSWSDMHALFPPAAPNDDVFGGDAMQGVLLSDGAPAKPRLNRWKAHQLRQTKSKRAKKESNAVSDMGLLGLLPGELRNFIYRLAFVPPTAEQPVVIAGSDLICGRGACVHKLAAVAAPAIASTCSQLRNEIMPIFTAENEFRFDAVMVRNRCAAFWAKSLNTYARLVNRVTLEVLVQTRIRTAIGGTDNQVGEITITCPVGSADGRFAVACTANISKANLDTSQLLPL